MFIQTEDTPNPLTVKFLPGRVVMEHGSAEFTSDEAAWRSPLLQNLFEVKGVSRIFLGSDFISVTKVDEANWQILRPSILGTIMAFFSRFENVTLAEHPVSEPSPQSCEEDGEVVREIKELLEAKVRPAVAQDGGDITFERFEDGIVYLRMKGACAGCPSSSLTLKSGVENMLRHYIPEVQEVRQVE